jgi:hypothetical protein
MRMTIARLALIALIALIALDGVVRMLAMTIICSSAAHRRARSQRTLRDARARSVTP